MMEPPSEIDFDASIQRGEVWGEKTTGLFIHSVMIGLPTGNFYFNELKDGNFECLDGQQRSKAVWKFAKNDFRLPSTLPPVYVKRLQKEVSVERKCFRNLPETLQSNFLSYSLEAWVFDDLTIEEKKEVFMRINSGVPVKSIEISRIDIKSRVQFYEMKKHPVIIAGVSALDRAKYIDEDIIEDVFCLIYNPIKTLAPNIRTKFLHETVMTKDQKGEMTKGLDYAHSFLREIFKNKALTKTIGKKSNMVSLICMGIYAARSGIEEKTFAEKAAAFFQWQEMEGKKDYLINLFTSANAEIHMAKIEAIFGT